MTHASTPPRHTQPTPIGLRAVRILTWSLLTCIAPAQAIPAPASTLVQAEASAPAWWAAFDDPVLRRLMQGSGATVDRQAAVFRSYVELQVGALRWRIARQIEGLAHQQRRQVEESDTGTEGRQQLLDLLARRSEHVEAVLSTLAQENQQRLTVLAALKGMDPGLLSALLAAADGAPRVPQVSASVPDQLPRLATHDERSDEQRQQALHLLIGAAARATRAQQLLQANRLSLDALKLRHEAGAVDPLAVMAAQLELLVQADHCVKAAGALAVAWAQLLRLTGHQLAQAALP